MAASRSVAGLLLLHLFTRCAADAVAGGPLQSPSAGGAGPPRTASIDIEDIKDAEDIDVDFPAQQPSVLAGEPGAYGVPAPSPTSGPPPIPAQLEPGAVLPRTELCMSSSPRSYKKVCMNHS